MKDINMKSLLVVSTVVGFLSALPSYATTLQDDLDALTLPANTVPQGTNKEKLYSIQTRMSPLSKRLELDVNGFSNVSLGDFVSSREVGATLKYHFSDNWSLGVSGSAVFNSLTTASKMLLDQDGILTRQPYAMFRYDLSPTLHTFYGKIRLTMDSTLYFDHYVSLGPSYIKYNTRSFFGGAADTGLLFWSGKHVNFNVGAKFYGFSGKDQLAGFQVSTLMHLGIGYVFGDGT